MGLLSVGMTLMTVSEAFCVNFPIFISTRKDFAQTGGQSVISVISISDPALWRTDLMTAMTLGKDEPMADATTVAAEMALALADTWEPLSTQPCGKHRHWRDSCPVCAPEFDESRWDHLDYFAQMENDMETTTPHSDGDYDPAIVEARFNRMVAVRYGDDITAGDVDRAMQVYLDDKRDAEDPYSG